MYLSPLLIAEQVMGSIAESAITLACYLLFISVILKKIMNRMLDQMNSLKFMHYSTELFCAV